MKDEIILHVHLKQYKTVQNSTKKYPKCFLRYLFQALKQISVSGKTVLVIGTMTPWVEAVILSK